jgi:hypothetical protein
MSRFIRSAVLAVALLAITAPAGAQPQGSMMPQLPRLFGQFTPTEGVWAQYSVLDKTTMQESKMRMAIVGVEGESYWYEVWLQDKTSRNVIKLLVAGDPNNPENIKRMIMKSGEGQATEMPRDFVVMGRKMAVHMFETRSGVSSPPDQGVKVEEVGQREVTVPAGTFTTTQSRIIGSDGKEMGSFDLSEKIPPFGVVTSETAQTKMDLLAFGQDATTAITEEPIKMTMPPGMPEGMPRGRPPGMMPGGGPPQSQ